MATANDGLRPSSRNMSFIFFTDLDGTLLDHHGYDWTPAVPALDRIRAEGWPLIPVTSKTRAEVEPLKKELGLDDPFVVENGGGVFLPDRPPWDTMGQVTTGQDGEAIRRLTLGNSYDGIRKFVDARGRALGVRGFGEMSVEEIMDRTGLDQADAERARQRDFSEPFVLEADSDMDALETAADEAGLAITRGGRFYHLMGAHQSKGRAVHLLQEAWSESQAEPVRSVALGDGVNDVSMLDAADLAVLIPAPGRPLPPVRRDDAVVAPMEGPAGWNAAVLALTGPTPQSERRRS